MNKFGMKNLGYGLGLRSQHYDYVLESKPKVDWFEVISENYMNTQGRPRKVLHKVRADYPIAMHGVSMSIGSSDELNMGYLQRLKDLAEEIQPEWISDHLCWTGIQKKNTHDLLPVPLTEECLAHVVERIKRVQDFLGRRILLENPSSYLTYRADEIPEYEFIARMAEEADCALLLDVNNIYVASFNQRLNPHEYIDAIPMERVVQMHLAGHQNKGTHIVDTHDGPVIDDVWQLYKYASLKEGFAASIMVEWDDKIPEFPVLEAEINRARDFAWQEPQKLQTDATQYERTPSNHGMVELHKNLQAAILDGDVSNAQTWISPKRDFSPEEQLAVYATGYRLRLRQIISSDYEVTMKVLGTQRQRELLQEYIETVPSEFYDVAKFSSQFASWLQEQNIDGFVKDLARLEDVISECYNLLESESLTYEDLAKVAPEDFVSLKLPLNASAKLSVFEYDVHEYLSTFYEGKDGEFEKVTTHIIAYLKAGKVLRMKLEENEFALLKLFESGSSIGEAMESVAQNSGMNEDELSGKIQTWFGRWVANGILQKPQSSFH